MMDIVGAIPLAATMIQFCLLTYMFAKSRKNETSRSYMIVVACCGLNALFEFLLRSYSLDHTLIMIFTRGAVAVWLPVAFLNLNFVYKLINKKKDLILYVLQGILIIFMILGLSTDLIIAGYRRVSWGIYTVAGSLYPAAIMVLILFTGFYAFFLMFQEIRKTSDKILSRQLTIVVLGMIVAFIFVVVNNIVLTAFLQMYEIPQLGASLLAIQTIFTFFAIYKYNFLTPGIREASVKLFANIRDGVIICNRTGEIVEVNIPARDFFKTSDGAIVGLQVDMIFRGLPYSFNEVFFDREFVFDLGYLTRSFLVSQTNLLERGALIGKLLIIRDITDWKHAQKKLIEEKQRAEEANQAKSMFLSNVSHEIRTPLNGIIGYTELITECESFENAKIYAGKSLDESQRLLELINDVLDISKIEAGKLEIVNRPFNFRDVITNIYTAFEVTAERKHLLFTTFVDLIIPQYFIGDALRIRQVLTNLVGNAIKFTQRGRVTVKVVLESREDNIYTLHFSVRDTGIGISQNRQKAIFSSFEQADASTTRQFGGTGLGTTIAKELVEMMGGSIGVDSEERKGSNFWFNLPLEFSPELEGKQKSGQEHQEHHFSSYSILIVEDYPPNRDILKVRLTSMGCKVAEAINGKEAVKAVELDNFDLIFMDVQMPEMDGYEASRIIKKLRPSIPIIGLTANAFKQDEEKCLEAGMNTVITKPIFKEALIKVLKDFS